MFRRGLAVLLCSALLAGSLPETSFAAESVEPVTTAESEAAETGTEEAESEKHENNASTNPGEAETASQTSVPETQSVSGTEQAETEETTEGKTDTSEETTETVTQAESETTSAVETEAATQTETTAVTETEAATETETVTETQTQTEETPTTVETEEATTEVETEGVTTEAETEEATTEVKTEEIENADGQETSEGSITYDVGALDVVAKLELKNTIEDADYNVRIQYKKHSTDDGWSNSRHISPTEEGIYEYTLNNLRPNTAYDIKFEITEYLSTGTPNSYTVNGTVTTKAGAVVTENVNTYLDAVRFDIALDPSVMIDDLSNYSSASVYPYVKDQDGKYTPLSNSSIYLSSNGRYRSATITGLESNKLYEVSFGSMEGETYYEYGTMSFKTLTDDRKITVDMLEKEATGFTVKGTLTGNARPYGTSSRIVLMYKESGSENENWNRSGVDAYSRKFEVSASVESGKTYDYAVGIDDGKTIQAPTDLRSAKTGTITLEPDERSVEITDTVSLLNGMVIRAKLLGRYINNGNTAYMLYREAGKAWDTKEIHFSGDGKETYTIIKTYNGEALKAGDYEYKLCMTIPEKEEDYADLPGATFKYEQQTDDRKLTVTSVTEMRNEAVFHLDYEGSVSAQRNIITVFYREKGSEGWQYDENTSILWNDIQPTLAIYLSDLNSETEYEYTLGISNDYISSVDDIAAGKLTGTFTTKDARTLGAPVVKPSYSRVEVDVDVDGLASDNNGSSTCIVIYTKEPTQQNADWTRSDYNYVSGNDNRAELEVDGLAPGVTYDYVLILSDDSYGITPDSEEFNKLPEGRKYKGTFTTNKSDYKLEITENAEKSVFDTEVLNLKVTSASAFHEKNFEAVLDIYEADGSDEYYIGQIFVPIISSGVDYSAEAVISDLTAGAAYKVKAKLTATVIANDSSTRETVGESEFAFKTKTAAAPTELKPEKSELWLNSWNQRYNDYCLDEIYIPIPDGVSSELDWTTSNPDVADIYDYGTTAKGTYAIVGAGIPGEATITAASVLALSVKAEIKIHVADYGVVFTNTDTPCLENSVSTIKNTISTNVSYTKIDRSTGKYTIVTPTATSSNPNVAYWDEKERTIVSKNASTTTIVLDADGYKTGLYVRVTADSPDLSLSISPDESATNTLYPALKQEDGSYQIAYGTGVNSYTVSVDNRTSLPYGIGAALKYTSSDEKVLTVSNNGLVEGKATGTATITVSYDMDIIAELAKENPQLIGFVTDSNLAGVKAEMKFDVKPIPPTSMPEVNAITNIHKTLGDVKPPEGWKWREPDTPLYSLPTNGNNVYEFDIIGTDFYNYAEASANTTKARVTISTFAGVNVRNNGRDVISAGGTDSMDLQITPVIYCYQNLKEDAYTVEIPSVANVTATKDENGIYKITASQKGKYTLKPEIKVGSETVTTGSYIFTAVDGTLVDHIEIVAKAEDTNVTIKGDAIYFNSAAGVTEFDLEAKAFDREDKEIADAKLTWATTDKSVADVKAAGTGKDAKVTIKSDGHALIRVTVADAAKVSSAYKLEARNYKPRVEGDKITINTAYDYSADAGLELSAAQYGVVSVASVYGSSIDSVQVVAADVEDGAKNLNGKVSKDFKAEAYNDGEYEQDYVITPVNPDMAAGKYPVKFAVTTDTGFIYTYPLAITVMKKEPKVSVKVSNSMNLFYLNEKGYLDVTLEKNKSKGTDFSIESIQWSNNADGGFKLNAYNEYDDSEGYGYPLPKTPNVKRCYIDGSKVKVSNGKLANPAVATGTVKIKLAGVRTSYNPSVTVKYSYKKPKLTTADSMTGKNVSTIMPSVRGGNLGSFSLKADKTLLYYTEDADAAYYNEYQCGNKDVTIAPSIHNDYTVSFSYSGTAEQFDIPVTVDSYYWREPLTTTHKVKAATPTAVLSSASLTYNTNYDSVVSTEIYLKDYAYYSYGSGEYSYSVVSAIDVDPVDQASYDLMANDMLKISTSADGENGALITAKLNPSKLGDTLPKGATYVLTPYYRDSATGESKELNKLTLKISFTNKKVTVKASGKGKLDLAVGYRVYSNSDFYKNRDYAGWLAFNSITVTPKFANLGSAYRVTGAKLTGEYSKYFNLSNYDYYDKKGSLQNMQYIKITQNGVGELKAGHNYNLYITYTLKDNNNGGTIIVKSNALKIKPVQKAPKITVVGTNRSLYMASPDLGRICQIRTPYYGTRLDKDYYEIEDAYGSLDTNKDGKADIEITLYDTDNDSGRAWLYIRLTEAGKHAVVAGPKGKAYTVPVTVRVTGRDGITKDAVIKVKVTVKK